MRCAVQRELSTTVVDLSGAEQTPQCRRHLEIDQL
jgi:hypothetical protein